jgi:diguanylate cyclase (GGDEF)-like protein
LVVTKDVTEQKNIEKRIEFMAHHDILTELPNRLLAKDRAIQALSRANRMQKKVGFLFIDLDNFKTINDSLGHSVGDELLKIVASRLQKCIRASDTISRQGGDEFIIILPDLNSTDEIFPIANKLIVEFKKIFDINNQTLSTTASIGVAVYPEHGDTFEQLLQNADAAMYKAKENGRNTYCVFTQQMKHNMLGIFKMQNDLNEAIEKKEFILHYQPQIDLTHNTIVGVEALIRWKHPLLGMIPPLNFISIAESSGIIVQIGEWVLQEACKQAAIWNKEGKNIVVAVNISAVQFKRGNLVEVVKNALKISGLNPQYLELELTESILISDTESVLNTVKIIKEMGVLLSIDDFGTGYSSLAYLKRFAVDKLKIDQSFVRDIVQDKDDATIVKTIIAMAKSFNLKAIAEGVENEAVLSALHEFGCDEVQGYYFAKPMIAHEFENYYEKRIN